MLQTDTPIAPPTIPRPSRLDQFKAVFGDLARPFAIYSTSLSASIAVVIIATKVKTFGEGATFIGAVFLGVGSIYGAKAWEAVQSGKQAASVEVAKVHASTPGVST